jgi:cytochrome c oxidase assembly factor CtaG
MKRNDIILVLSAIAFSGLFFGQTAGINFLLFSLIITAALLIFNPDKIKDKRWWLYAVCANAAGFAVFSVNSELSILAFVAALLALCGNTCFPGNSIVVKGIFAAYSIVRAPIDIALNTRSYYQTPQGSNKANTQKLILGLSVALVIAILFLLLYREANPLFNDFTKKLDLDWLNVSWILFTLLGLIIVYGLLKCKKIHEIYRTDLEWQKDEQRDESTETSPWETTTIIAAALFAILNLMLLVMNALDVRNIYVTKKLPEGITLSDFVHQAVGSTAASILFAVAIIVWIFKGQFNFSRSSKLVKLLVYAWIIQSALVVLNSMVRNYWYIEEYQLTHLRICVFVFLILCICGLSLTYMKVSDQKSAWWLASRNLHAWFLTFVVFTLFNWDQIISNYNIKNASASKPLDKEFLLRLGEGNLPQLARLHNAGEFNHDEKLHFYRKVIRAYRKNRFQQWPSYSLRMEQSNKTLTDIRL